MFDETEEILDYREFKKKKTEITSGVVFIYNKMILLIHPYRERWYGAFSYPKGHIDIGETIREAAIREVEEEIGINMDESLLSERNLYRIVNEEIGKIKIAYFYVVNLTNESFEKLFEGRLILKRKKLQKNEIDWAGFITKEQAKERIKPRLISVLDHI